MAYMLRDYAQHLPTCSLVNPFDQSGDTFCSCGLDTLLGQPGRKHGMSCSGGAGCWLIHGKKVKVGGEGHLQVKKEKTIHDIVIAMEADAVSSSNDNHSLAVKLWFYVGALKAWMNSHPEIEG